MDNIRTITTTALTTALLGLSIVAGPADAMPRPYHKNQTDGLVKHAKPKAGKAPQRCVARSRAQRHKCR